MVTEKIVLKFSSTLIDVAETWTSFELDKNFQISLNIIVRSEFFKLIKIVDF